ncbi:hypothetical protein Aab01nite_48830 [Paractinoplanes abujensis]|nr:hypothetical protein Aab01nite_48830 [Actinoplanes abujensis]
MKSLRSFPRPPADTSGFTPPGEPDGRQSGPAKLGWPSWAERAGTERGARRAARSDDYLNLHAGFVGIKRDYRRQVVPAGRGGGGSS